MPKSNTESHLSTKDKVFKMLNKNSILMPKQLCKLMDLPYEAKGRYMRKLRHLWRLSLKFGQGSKPHEWHKAHGWVYVDRLGLDRALAVVKGWVPSRNRNKALIFKDDIGRMEWHWKSGRVNLFVKQPSTKGRFLQLFCKGFSWTGLIQNQELLESVLGSIRLKGATAVWQMGQRMPYLDIDLFKANGINHIKCGDASHPAGIEVEFCYPDWAEKNEHLLFQTQRALEKFMSLCSQQTTQPEPQGSKTELPDFYNK